LLWSRLSKYVIISCELVKLRIRLDNWGQSGIQVNKAARLCFIPKTDSEKKLFSVIFDRETSLMRTCISCSSRSWLKRERSRVLTVECSSWHRNPRSASVVWIVRTRYVQMYKW
jgi:hypothetical protein